MACVCCFKRRFTCVPGPVLVVPALSYVLSVPAPCDLQMKHWIHHDLRERGRKTMIFTLLLSAHPKPLFSLPALSLTHTHTTPPPMSLTCMLHSLDRHTVGNHIITLSHTAANSGVATIQNSRAALTLNFHMKVGAIKYRPEGRNWPAGREFETPGLNWSPPPSNRFCHHHLTPLPQYTKELRVIVHFH